MEYHVDRIQLDRQDCAVVRGTVAPDQIASFLGGAFGEVMGVLTAQGVHPDGPPFACYVAVEGGFEIEAGFPVSEPVQPAGRVLAGELPSGWVLLVMHRGPYDQVAAAYAAAEQWLVDNDWEAAGPGWEAYLDGPEVPEPRTIVHLPVRAR